MKKHIKAINIQIININFGIIIIFAINEKPKNKKQEKNIQEILFLKCNPKENERRILKQHTINSRFFKIPSSRANINIIILFVKII